MEKESFEDNDVANILNENFISIKVDRELRPDLDSIYMSICQAMTGSGGWPMSIFLTPDQKPFFAGTYFPKTAAYGQLGFTELLHTISHKWNTEKAVLLASAEASVTYLQQEAQETDEEVAENNDLLKTAIQNYQYIFDKENGGFGNAPKFPAAHNLLFLLAYHTHPIGLDKPTALEMVELTLEKLWKGGIFDHIGGGFSRYSTDAYFLVPHFEKMLYDNALLMMAYAKTFQLTGKAIYRTAAEQTVSYILNEMTSPEGGFYSALDADSEGEEGKFYTFTAPEIIEVLGQEAGETYNRFYGITTSGNFEGKNIPNLLHHRRETDVSQFTNANKALYEYRKSRTKLHLDDKMLTAWNYLMIGALAAMYQVFEKEEYRMAAEQAAVFIEKNLIEEGQLYVGYREGERMNKGFLDEYAYGIFAMLKLYDITLERKYLRQAEAFLKKVLTDFADQDGGGFFLNGSNNEKTIARPKETYDGAIPSGNSVMAYNLVRMAELCNDDKIRQQAKKQLRFMERKANAYPTGYSFFLLAYLADKYPAEHLVCVLKEQEDLRKLKKKAGLQCNIIIYEQPTAEYPLVNDQTTYYICRDYACLPPTNEYE